MGRIGLYFAARRFLIGYHMKMGSQFLGRQLLSLAIALTVSSLAARGAERYEGKNWAFLDTRKAMDVAAEITQAKYPDCDEATVEKKMVRVYRPDGTGESQDESFLKVMTEKGKRNNRTIGLSFMLPYETVEVVKVEVIKPSREVQAVDVAANSKEMIDDSQMGMNIYDPNSKVLDLSIPQLEIGDVVHSITRTTTQRAIMEGEAAEYNVFEGSGYIRHLVYEVHAPSKKPLQRIVLRDEVPGTIKYSKQAEGHGITFHRWEVTNVPRMFDEPSMPPYEMVLQRLLVSTTHDWQTVSKWYWNLCVPHLDATTPEMKKTVAELTADAQTDMEKMKAVFYYVSKKVRYMGITPEKDRPGFEPHDVRMCFDNKFGVCRDKAALLVSMLRLAGVKAYPVLINVGIRLDQDAPSPDFNHAIVAVELEKGNYTLMDPTAENTKVLLPSYESDRSFLVCRPEGETLKTSPIDPPDQNMMLVKTEGVLDAAGGLEAKTQLSFEGINDNAYREGFSQMKPDDRRRFFEGNLKRALPGARLKSLKITPDDMQDVSKTVRADLEFSVDGMLATSKGKAVANLPWLGQGLGAVSFILNGTGLEKRKYPLQTEVACGLHEDVSVKLGDGFTGALSTPSCSPVNDDSLSYARSVQFDNQTLSGSTELKLKVVEFSPEEYLKLKKMLQVMAYDERKAMVLAADKLAAKDPVGEDPAPAPQVESNARILESRKELEVKDAHTSLYRVKYSKQILTYSGKKNEAEIKIDYNPSCQEARLISGTVISKTGERKEIKKEEINVMDAGWNAGAKRYTGGKILVANLPGVDIGSTIEVAFEITTHGKPFVSGFEAFQLFDDLDKKSFRLTASAGVPIQKLETGASGVMKEETTAAAGKQTFEWRAENVKALPAERQLPPDWSYLAGVDYFAGDMGSYLKELNNTMMDRSGHGAKAGEVARKITGQAKTKLEAMVAIRDFVAKSIRVAGPGFAELPLKELSAADTTLSDGYGHLADRAILLHSMLSAAGFGPEFVLASELPSISGITNVALSFPLPQSFETPLIKVAVDGQNYYLNDTDQYARLGASAHDGRLAIDLASQEREVIQPAPGCQDKVDTAYTLSLGDDGKTRIGITKSYYGSDYGANHKYFAELPPEERRRYYQELVSDVVQGARPVGDLKTDFDAYPGLLHFTVEIDNYGVVDGNYLYFDLPFTASLFPAGADHRSLPLFLSHESEKTVHTEIELPPGYRQVVIAPQSEDLHPPGGGGNARIVSTTEPGKYLITHDLENTPAIVGPKDYAAMLHVESELGRKSSRVFLLEKD